MGGHGEESIVYVQRPAEIPPSLSTSKNPIKRHRSREDSSVAWYNLEKTKPLKEYRCAEFDDYTRKADSSKHIHPMEDLKYGGQKNVISNEFKFEIQEQVKELQSSGAVQERTASRAKKTRWMHLPEDANCLKNSVLHPKSLDIPPLQSTVDNSSLKPSLAAEPASSKSTECDSSASNLEVLHMDQVYQPSDGVKRKKSKLKEEVKTRNDQQKVNMELKSHNRDGTNSKTREYLASEVMGLPQYASIGNGLDRVCAEDVIGTALVDVDLTVKASYRPENVPFVCLTSKLNGKAILGYPLEIGELSNCSETLLPRKESVIRKLFDDKGGRFQQLVWRTSRRTPVCYVTNSLSSSISKDVQQAGQACSNVEDSIPPARENDLLIKEESLMKLLKNPKQFKQGKAALSRTCVPVEIIFSRILTAVGQVKS